MVPLFQPCSILKKTDIQCLSELLTNAIRLLSGDQEGAFSVPCPPNKYASTLGAPPAAGINRSMTF